MELTGLAESYVTLKLPMFILPIFKFTLSKTVKRAHTLELILSKNLCTNN